jgi:hypothetical protein
MSHSGNALSFARIFHGPRPALTSIMARFAEGVSLRMRIKTAAVAAMTVLSIVLVIGCTSVGDYARRYEARQAGVDPDQLKLLQDEAQSERAECDQGSQTACIAYQNSLGEIRDWHNNYAAGKRAEASSQQRPVQTNCIDTGLSVNCQSF